MSSIIFSLILDITHITGIQCDETWSFIMGRLSPPHFPYPSVFYSDRKAFQPVLPGINTLAVTGCNVSNKDSPALFVLHGAPPVLTRRAKNVIMNLRAIITSLTSVSGCNRQRRWQNGPAGTRTRNQTISSRQLYPF